MTDKLVQDIDIISSDIVGNETILVEQINKLNRIQLEKLTYFFISKFVNSEEFNNKIDKENIKCLTLDEYDNLEIKDQNTLYFIKEE